LAPDTIGDALLYYEAGEQIDIIWTATAQSAVAPVQFNLLRDFEFVECLGTFEEIGSPESPGCTNGCEELITIPADVVGQTNYQIQVMDMRYPEASAVTRAFTIQSGTIDIYSPFGGVQLYTGEEFRISWQRPGATGRKVDISLLRDDVQVRAIASGVENDDLYNLGGFGDRPYYGFEPTSIAIMNGASPTNGYITEVELYIQSATVDELQSGWELRVYSQSPAVVGQDFDFTLVRKQSFDVSACPATGRCIVALPEVTKAHHMEIDRGQYVAIAKVDGPLRLARSTVEENADELHGYWRLLYIPDAEVPSELQETVTDFFYPGAYYTLGMAVSVSPTDTMTTSSYLWKVDDSVALGDNYRIEVRSTDHDVAADELVDQSDPFAIIPTANFMIDTGTVVTTSSNGGPAGSESNMFDGSTTGQVWKSSTFKSEVFETQVIQVELEDAQIIDEISVWWAFHQDAAAYDIYFRTNEADDWGQSVFGEFPCSNSRIDTWSFFTQPVVAKYIRFELRTPCYTGDDTNTYQSLNQFGIFEIEIRGCPSGTNTCPDLTADQAQFAETCFQPGTGSSCSGLSQGDDCECVCNAPNNPTGGDEVRSCGLCSHFWRGTDLTCGDAPPVDTTEWQVDIFMNLQKIEIDEFTAREEAYQRSILDVVSEIQLDWLTLANVVITSVTPVVIREPGDGVKEGIEVTTEIVGISQGQAEFAATQITAAILNSMPGQESAGKNLPDTFEEQGLGKSIIVGDNSFAVVVSNGGPDNPLPPVDPTRPDNPGDSSGGSDDSVLIGLTTFFGLVAAAGVAGGLYMYKKNQTQAAELQRYEMSNYTGGGMAARTQGGSGGSGGDMTFVAGPPVAAAATSTASKGSASTSSSASASNAGGYVDMEDDDDKQESSSAAVTSPKKSKLSNPFAKKKEEPKKGLADMADQSDGSTAADAYIDVNLTAESGSKSKKGKKGKGKDSLDSEYFQELHDEL
jgi:hypothetical protein